MKLRFAVKLEEHLAQLVRDDQGRRIVAMVVKEEEAGDINAAKVIAGKPAGASAGDLLAWGERRSQAIVAQCLVAYEVTGEKEPIVCKSPNEEFRGWSPKAKAYATTFYNQMNGTEEAAVKEAFETAQVAT